MNNPEITTEVNEAITIKHGDLVITLSSSPDGIMEGKTLEQVYKYCADVLLAQTEESSLENMIDTPMALIETLTEDFGFETNAAFDFIRKWKRRIYIKQIGKENPVEQKDGVTGTVEPSSDPEGMLDEVHQDTGKQEEKKDFQEPRPRPKADDSNLKKINVPMLNKITKKETQSGQPIVVVEPTVVEE